MGQPINVVLKPSRTPGIARFETNRSLTGMGHERYESADDIIADRAVDELARRLFATGQVEAVHVNNSVITVQLTEGATGESLLDVIRGLYIHYPASDADVPPVVGATASPPSPPGTEDSATSNGDVAS